MSDVGRVRKNNEDNFVVCNLTTGEATLTPALCSHQLGPRGTLFMVADGMGGEACGEVGRVISLTQAVGRSESLDVKVTYTKLCQGDSLLLCSDGLYNMLKSPDLLGV